MKYRKLKGIVLKKQNYKEADQIVTVWTEQAGKVRCLAKALRSSKSKLAYAMQPLSLVEIEVAEKSSLPTLVSARAIRLYQNLRQDLKKTALALFAEELMLKMTPDEQKNLQAYRLLVELLDYLEGNNTRRIRRVQDCFALKLLETLGYSAENAGPSFRMTDEVESAVRQLATSDLKEAGESADGDSEDHLASQVHRAVIKLIEFVLERNIKSDTFLTQI